MADDDRKSRLAALREKANKSKGQDEGSAVEQAAIKFRNYKPQDSALQQPKKRPHEEGDAATEGDSAENRPAKNKKVEAEEQDVIARELKELASDEINIVPKKPNWDLKQQVSGKLDKLRRRTQRAIVDILREKVAAENADDID